MRRRAVEFLLSRKTLRETTLQWWRDAADRFELVASELVINEASAGDADAARAHLAALKSVTLLDATAAEDAGHFAIAVTNGVDYLVTWNCRHIANATMRSQIERICRIAGYEPTIICTPDELMEG